MFHNSIHNGSIVALCLVAVAAVACNGSTETSEVTGDAEITEVTGVYDKAYDFAMFQTFSVVAPTELPEGVKPPPGLLPVNLDAITNTIVAEMEGRGYTRDQAGAQLEISTFVRLRDVDVVTDAPDTWDDYYYGWYWGYAYPWYTEDLIQYPAGTLIIDVVDIGDRDDESDDVLVFRGTATELLPVDPVDVSPEIERAVTDIFRYWPTS